MFLGVPNLPGVTPVPGVGPRPVDPAPLPVGEGPGPLLPASGDQGECRERPGCRHSEGDGYGHR